MVFHWYRSAPCFSLARLALSLSFSQHYLSSFFFGFRLRFTPFFYFSLYFLLIRTKLFTFPITLRTLNHISGLLLRFAGHFWLSNWEFSFCFSVFCFYFIWLRFLTSFRNIALTFVAACVFVLKAKDLHSLVAALIWNSFQFAAAALQKSFQSERKKPKQVHYRQVKSDWERRKLSKWAAICTLLVNSL